MLYRLGAAGMTPSFEWDEEKASRNLKDHKVSFDEAVTVLRGGVSAFNAVSDTVGDQRRREIGGDDTSLQPPHCGAATSASCSTALTIPCRHPNPFYCLFPVKLLKPAP